MTQYNCRFHPTDWFHEIGCDDLSGKEWYEAGKKEGMKSVLMYLDMHYTTGEINVAELRKEFNV